MTREEHLAFCSVCKNRKTNLRQGLLCGLTDEMADFEGECESFVKDELEEVRLLNVEMAYAGDDNIGDPFNFTKNKRQGMTLLLIGIGISIASFSIMEDTGFFVIAFGAPIYGLFLLLKGLEQEKIYLKHQQEKEKEEENKN